MRRSAAAGLAALLTMALATACTLSGDGAGTASAPATTPAATSAARPDARPADLTDANLEAYGRALAKQAEIIRRPGRGTHYGMTMSPHGLEGEAGEVLAAAGMDIETYRAVEAQVEPVFTVLNFRGEIGPPRAIDLEAAPEWKAKLEADPFATLSPASAAALRRHMDALVPL